MKKFKKILCFVIPFVVIIAIAISVIVPLCLNNKTDVTNKNFSAEERASGSDASDSGASTADKSKKGGAIYLEPYATYTMNGGTISGSSNTYGGAIFISTGATFIMNGGTISGCSAEYGGGIYVSTGATLTIKAGTITGCTASKQGPAIYIEDGAIVDIDEKANISKNDIYQYSSWNPPEVGAEETMGGTYTNYWGKVTSTVKLRTMYFGTYPQTYVGDTMNTALESWYSNQPAGQTYTIRDRVWTTYEYQGEKYVRGASRPYETDYKYHDGTTIKANGTAVWFKVEPIKWYILNYDAWQNGTEDIELLSELALTGYIRFDDSSNVWKNSELELWLNNEFYNSAFDANEQEIIKESEVKNNVSGNYDSSTSDGSGTTTYDKVYCKSYYEMSSGKFVENSDVGNGYVSRLCSPTDFALSNYCFKGTSTSWTTAYYPSGGTCQWWLRSAGSSASRACTVSDNGSLGSLDVASDYRGVRAALHLSI